MKVQVNRDVLAEAVGWCARILPTRPALPVLTGLLLDASGDLRISAFDYDVSARADVDAAVAEPGQVLLPGRVLAEIVRSLPGEVVDITTSGTEAVLTCGSAEFGLLTMPADDFPTLPPMPAKVGAVGGALFASAVAQVAVAASRDNTLPMLTAIRVDTDGVNMTMAATDRYRMAARDFLWHPEGEAQQQYGAMIPAKVLVDVAKSLRVGEVSICLGGNVAGFESAGRSTTVRLLDEQFIDYRSRLSGDWGIRATVSVQPFLEAIRRVALVSGSNSAVRLSFSQGQVLIQAAGDEIGRGAEMMEADLDGDDILIAFQPHFLLEGLAGVETEQAVIHLDSPTRPALITDAGDDPAFRYLVMSLRIN
ncbi:DNA polymerase III subunit beta [Herbidospora galbida]|uniref:Beta sliding clamp n=1 Tax=Herbidospora galbida TaxID=2575442 RepID=A0A4U3MCI0_9ACTN|nr:DNA polymerase III subunit beta [Herbidospora galbida]TKK85864.1 DNA polymerase III subunit beta [Herbidospora galbida]